MYKNKYISQAFLESCVRECKFILDTSALMEESSTAFFKNIVPILKRENKVILVPLSVKLELEKLANNPDCCKRKRAIKALELLTDNAQVIKFFGDNDCKFADNDILATVTKMRLKDNLVLVTQDHNLASETLKLGKDTKAVRNVKKIFAQRLDEDGFLQKVFDKSDVNVYHTPFGEFKITCD